MPKNSASNRLDRFRRLLSQKKIPAMMVSGTVNITYLTGFTGDSSYLVVTPTETAIISDSRYATQLAQECPQIRSIIKGDSGTTWHAAAEYVNSLKLSGLAVETHVVTKATYDQISELFKPQLLSATGIVEEMRAIKDDDELARIRHAIRINERVFQIIRTQLRGDQTERAVGYALENEMRALGGEGCAFPPIVGVGPRSALPHGGVSDIKIDANPILLIDWGTRCNGYVSDLTRILTTGKVPAKYAKIYEVVRTAQLKAIEKIKAGVDCQVVDKAARAHIDSAGFGKFFGHGLGHGIGMQVHESPYFSPSRKGILAEGMVVTVEPGIYLPELGGVRIEDDVLVTKDGCEVISSLPTDIESTHVELF
jgi:Xaa-Pro aminopeptidase